jgi:ATP adenylyltransferase
MTTHTFEREEFDLDSYVKRIQTDPCFICEIVAGNSDYRHHLVYEDDTAIAFLNRYPTLYGYTLVAPRQHKEQVTGDFTPDEYLALQRLIYRVAEAVRLETQAERVYILSLGSQQGNSHVHWHIAPLPPGVSYDEQQLQALMMERGVLKPSEGEQTALAERLRKRLGAIV